MKKITFGLIFMLINLSLFSQIADLLGKEGLSLDMLLQEAENIGSVDISKSRELKAILNLDVIDYHRLENKYDSELKLKVFKESEEYTKLLNELKTKKNNMLKETYYLKISPLFKAHNYHKGKYNLDDKGFYIRTCWNQDYDFSHKIDKNYLYFKSFPSKLIVNDYYGNHEEFFIPVSENEAIEIEENPTNFSFYIVFKFSGTEKVKWKNTFSDGTITLPKSDKIRLLIVENSSKKIIYDRVH